MNFAPPDPGTLRRSERIGGLIYLPMFLIGNQFLAAWIVFLFNRSITENEALGPVNLVYSVLNALALVLIFRHYLIEQLRRVQARGWSLFADLLFGFLVYYGLSVLASGVAADLQTMLRLEPQNVNQEAVEYLLTTSPRIAILSACVLAPISEELVFRGLIFCGLHKRSRILAYAVSMFSFAFVHLLSSLFSQPIAGTLIALLAYLPHGFALAWIYERSGSIWSSVFLHAGLNTISFLLLYAIR